MATARPAHPYDALRLGAAVAALHLGAWVPIFLLGVRYRFDRLGMMAVEVVSWVWLALPLLCVYGVILGRRGLAAGHGRPAVLGIAFNALYLMFGALLLLGVAAGRL